MSRPSKPARIREECEVPYVAYVDLPTRVVRIHRTTDTGGCGSYERRKPDPLANNWWTEPCETPEELAQKLEETGLLLERRECRKC